MTKGTLMTRMKSLILSSMAACSLAFSPEAPVYVDQKQCDTNPACVNLKAQIAKESTLPHKNCDLYADATSFLQFAECQKCTILSFDQESQREYWANTISHSDDYNSLNCYQTYNLSVYNAQFKSDGSYNISILTFNPARINFPTTNTQTIIMTATASSASTSTYIIPATSMPSQSVTSASFRLHVKTVAAAISSVLVLLYVQSS